MTAQYLPIPDTDVLLADVERELLVTLSEVREELVAELLSLTRGLTPPESTPVAKSAFVHKLLGPGTISTAATRHPAVRTLYHHYVRVRQSLTLANVRFVVRMAGYYSRRVRSLERSDLEQEGYLGLALALDRVDRSYACRFLTYASWWIRQSMTKAIIKTTTGRDYHGARVPTVESLERHIARDSRMRLRDTLPAKGPAPEERLERQEQAKEARKLVATLPPRHRHVVTLRFGLDGQPPMDIRQIARTARVTHTRVRQVCTVALESLRQMTGAPTILPFRMPTKSLTPRQRVVCELIETHVAAHGKVPTVRSIGRALGIASPNGVHGHLKALERKGVRFACAA